MMRASLIFLCLALILNAVLAVERLRKASSAPKEDGNHIQTEKEFASNYTKDENGPGNSGTAVKDLQSEKEFHENYTTDDRPDPNAEKAEHGEGSGARMVPKHHYVEGEKKDHHEDHHWSYDDHAVWGDGYEQCNGKSQSPIDIQTEAVKSSSSPQKLSNFVKYMPLSGRAIEDNGHNVQVNGEFGTVQLPDGLYNVRQFHFHFPSEHEVNGKLAAGEIHIVHQKHGAKGTDDLAVIAILLEVGHDLPEHKESLDFLKNLGFGEKLPANGEKIDVKKSVDLNAFSKELAGDFYHYEGSLTTPPCSQTVHWYVLQQPAVVTKEMVASFKKLFAAPANNRPVAPLNGRPVVFSKLETGPGEFPVAQAKSSSVRAGLAVSFAAVVGLRVLVH